MGAEWFRNQTWDETIERGFNEKVRRAKKKDQYLRIQALTLARSHPEIALSLLDHYFCLEENFFYAQAYVDRATALLTLGRLDEAIESYEAALAREIEFPTFRTPAYFRFAIPDCHAEHSGAVCPSNTACLTPTSRD